MINKPALLHFFKIHPDHTGGQDGRGEGLLEIAKACI